MKITSSTSMTSISGVMLMSLIGCDAGRALEAAEGHASALAAPARRSASIDHLAQVVGEAFELGLAAATRLPKTL